MAVHVGREAIEACPSWRETTSRRALAASARWRACGERRATRSEERPNKIPIIPGRKTPSRCPECRGKAWSRPPPANSYADASGWQVIRERVLVRDGYWCRLRYPDICVGLASQVDHIVQPESGDGSDLENLRACMCGVMPGVPADRGRSPSSAEPLSGSIPGEVLGCDRGNPEWLRSDQMRLEVIHERRQAGAATRTTSGRSAWPC